jgi:hypothetical protein
LANCQPKKFTFSEKKQLRGQSISPIGRALYAKNNPLSYSRPVLRGILPASSGGAEFFGAETEIWLHGRFGQKAVD